MRVFRQLVVSSMLLASLASEAKTTLSQVVKMGISLSPMGAEMAPNADGSIPPWAGSMRGLPQGLSYKGTGSAYPNPYAAEPPLFTITAKNMKQYQERLSVGQIAMFKRYPDTFKMHIYPSHRDGRFSSLIERRTRWNATNTVLSNGVDGLSNFTGGAPFPLPANGAEVMHNARIIHPHGSMDGVLDDVAVYSNNTRSMRRQHLISDFPFASVSNDVGHTEKKIGKNAAYIHVNVIQPRRSKGQMTMVHEAVDHVHNARRSWVYLPGSRRVRRAPTVGYDTPDGPGGMVTVDDSLGFNGAMDRYNWTLIGKKEVYIPYHSYHFDTPAVSYKKLLWPRHANPKYMRYELHRVWVVEANLKRKARHIYSKRRFYIDEDSWQFALLESYDGNGDLWRVGILNTVYDYHVQGYIARAQMFHDLQSGDYVAMRLVNETKPTKYADKLRGKKYYSPKNLRKLGKR